MVGQAPAMVRRARHAQVGHAAKARPGARPWSPATEDARGVRRDAGTPARVLPGSREGLSRAPRAILDLDLPRDLMKLSKAGTFLPPLERALMIEGGPLGGPVPVNTVTFGRVLGRKKAHFSWSRVHGLERTETALQAGGQGFESP